MTIHNQVSRLTEVQRGAKVAFGLDAGAGGLERLGETIQVVKDFWRYPEDAHLRGERLVVGGGFVAAGGAGNYTGVSLAMQLEGHIAVIERIIVTTGTAGIIVVKRGTPLPTAATTRAFRDMRATPGSPIAQLATINNVAAVPGGTFVGQYDVLASSPLDIPAGFVLVAAAPVATETGIVIYHATANVALKVNFYWRERTLVPGELYR